MKVHVWEEGSEWHFLIVSDAGEPLSGQGGYREQREAELSAAIAAKAFGFVNPWQLVKKCGCAGPSEPGLPVPYCKICGKYWEFEWQTEGKPQI